MNPAIYNRFAKIFGVPQRGHGGLRKDADSDVNVRARVDQRMDTDADDTDEPLLLNDDGGSSPTGAPTRHLSELADALVAASKSKASEGEIGRSDALHWLLNTYQGQRMAHRLASRHKRAPVPRKDQPMESHFELMTKAVRQFGLSAFAKSVANGDVHCTESAYSALVKAESDRTAVPFSKLLAEPAVSEGWRAARDAAWIKAGRQQQMPTKPTYSDETAAAVNDGGDAYNQLVAMAEKMHAAAPGRTVAQHFSAIYQDPKFRDKAARERAQARSRLPITGGRVTA